MALHALQLGVPTFQGIVGLCMLGQAELRGLESIYRMTGGALALVGTFGKLAAVGIGVVAVHAVGKH